MLRLAMLLALVCPPSVTEPPARAAVQEAYGELLWEMMFLDWCSGRSQRPDVLDTAKVRLMNVQARAGDAGFETDLEAARQRHVRRLETIRLDTSCRGGLQPQLAKTERAFAELERAMMRPMGRQR